MSTTSLPYILAHVFVDRIVWVMVADGETIACRECTTLGDLALEQSVSGILSVALVALVHVGEASDAIRQRTPDWQWATDLQAAELARRVEQFRAAKGAAPALA